MQKLLKPLSVGLLLGCGVFFFVGGPTDLSTRSVQRAWDLGHVLFFFCAGLGWLSWRRKPTRHAPMRDWIVVLATVSALGLFIEGAQSFLGRDASLGDLLRNNLGAVLALTFGGKGTLPSSVWAAIVLRGFGAAFLLVAVTPLGAALVDEANAARAFPVLSDFETPFQLSRWGSRENISIERDTVRRGRGSVRIPLSTAHYSGVGLNYFPGDWRGASALSASVFNPDSTPLELVVRVHDEWHDSHGQRYDDRYNASFTIRKGWNDLTIPIGDIASGPRNRVMDLATIAGLSFFTVRLPEPRTIFLDQVELR